MHLIDRKQGLALEGGDDQITSCGREVSDVADGAGAGTFGSAEGLANEVGDVGFAVLTFGGGGLDEHGLHRIA